MKSIFSIVFTLLIIITSQAQDMTVKKDTVVNDTLSYALGNLVGTSLKSQGFNELNIDDLSKGILQVKGFIYSEVFHLEKAITYAAKVAYMATVIKYGQTDIKKFDAEKIQEMKDWLIKEPTSTKFNKFKKSNPEAFFYLYQLSEITSSTEKK